MTMRQIFLSVLLIGALAVGVVVGLPLRQSAGMLGVVTLFLAGAVAGMSIVALRTRRSIRIPVASQSPKRGNDRPARQGGRGRGRKQQRQPRKKPARQTGTVKWFDDTKGFGFITQGDGGQDCFVHRSAIEAGNSLQEGAEVEFHVVTDEKGRQAAANVVSR